MEYKFGDKIREIREKKKITLKEVAEKAFVSESLISQIERNKVSPAIDTLLKIAEIIDIDLEYLFSDFKRTKSVSIVKNDERKKIIIEGISYEQISKTVGSNNDYDIEAYFLEIKPEHEKGSKEYGHIGREFGIIIEGKGEFIFGKEKYILEKGDSISFSSDIPHILKNIGSDILKAFWVVTPPKMFSKQI
ncbi:MAG: XRE family transcriptional regulator [Spirochaetes bacterium GWD1_27_9]|nr:MAG: XRE family transcriptional regulator [Spirochaetes bacterium GWB1_27_13]OHD26583.1 MAG: XRE family transcriptional regulator [Spirochaetes bacterium GWC1_27_15]OHD45601.1 MAG: XRE family transcriptional regulator [Spirochaetes bacterium GWD1_27_9]